MFNMENPPNPLIEKCLEDMIGRAKSPKVEMLLKKALTELRKYPLPLKSGRDCVIIRGFGKNICRLIDEWLERYKRKNELMIEKPKSQNVNKLKASEKTETTVINQTNCNVIEPLPGSSEYAMLLTMYNKSQEKIFPGYFIKKDLIKETIHAFKTNESSPPTASIRGFTSMAKLLDKKLVRKVGVPSHYTLTNTGTLLAKKLLNDTETVETFLIKKKNNSPIEKNSPDKFEIVLSDSDEDINQFRKENAQPVITPRKNETFSSEIKDKFVVSPINSKKLPEDLLDCIEITSDVEMDNVSTGSSPLKSNEDTFEFPDCSDLLKKSINDQRLETPKKKVEECIDLINDSPEVSPRKSPVIIKELPKKSPHRSPYESYRVLEELLDHQKKTKTPPATPIIDPDEFYLLPNNIDIILLVDKQETCGGKTKPKDDETISELTKAKILFEVKSLKVGDFAWIARCKLTNKELVLPFIVERKTLDDLSCSIKDGRYHEQKFRLSQCGIKNIIYMIENYGSTYRGGIPLPSLLQAGSNSLIQDNFDLQFTKSHKDSMRYLATMTEELTKIYAAKELISCKKENLETNNSIPIHNTEYLMVFDEFNKSAAKYKNYTVQNLLTRQLIKLSGMSAEKAAAISKKYPTPRVLAKALEHGGENLLADISIGPTKKIGPSISKTVYLLYSKHELD